jgi:hypothetical protein
MAKGGAAPLLLIGAAAVVGGYMVLSGKVPGYGQGTPDVDPGAAVSEAGNAASQAGESGLNWFLSTAWAPAALVAVVGAYLAVKFWQKIGGFGRAFLLIVAAIAATIFVLGIQR